MRRMVDLVRDAFAVYAAAGQVRGRGAWGRANLAYGQFCHLLTNEERSSLSLARDRAVFQEHGRAAFGEACSRVCTNLLQRLEDPSGHDS
jgi:hypothetical protein